MDSSADTTASGSDTKATNTETTAATGDSSGTEPGDGGGGETELPDASAETGVSSESGITDADVGTEHDSAPPDSNVDEPLTCQPGELACGDRCVRGNSCMCGSSCEINNAIGQCLDGTCAIAACNDGYFDCDGDVKNGCEVSLATEEPPNYPQPVPIPRLAFDMALSEITQDVWDGVPRFPLDKVCVDCERNYPPENVPAIEPPENRDVRPSVADLHGSAALAWNEQGLWLNVVVFDDAFVVADAGAGQPPDPRLYDNVMVVWDNEPGQSSANTGSDRILYAGIDGVLRDWRMTSTDGRVDGVSVATAGQNSCRIINLRLSGDYLVNNGGNASVGFVAGDQRGLNIGYNDFEPDDTSTVTRQSLVFVFPMSMSPGDYFNGDRTLSQIELLDQ